MILKAVSANSTDWVDGISRLTVIPNDLSGGDGVNHWMEFGSPRSNDCLWKATVNWHGKLHGVYCYDNSTNIYLLDDSGDTIGRLLLQSE